MIGDRFLKGIRENVELSLNNKFSIYSMVKPGSDLKTLLESAKNALETLTHKNASSSLEDQITYFDIDKPIIDHIMDFIKTNNHTNIVLTNVLI